ncbi:acyl-coenzyme A thioesterase 2, chloroplastic-like isoform X1 [Rosa rugosa]|uniref:acyl-coenzyme A thioesterase 2, chloroplastic-like isoform X1 n=1 Tax=Rosa rugosa TaxID=74645 RepID=UPI002B403D2C|nr:acyl-coenzyme A thioesterase 2, chloroplastic-like isoform X1 [Rosa rugosa]
MDPNSSPSNSNSNTTIPVVATLPAFGSDSLTRKPISLWPGMFHSPVTQALWEARSHKFERLLDPPADAPPQSELLNKTPSQSRTTILYNFSTDFILREQYRDPWNEVRIGKLLEDLDALAGTISVKVDFPVLERLEIGGSLNLKERWNNLCLGKKRKSEIKLKSS